MRKKIVLLIVAIFIVLVILLLSVFFMYYNRPIIEAFPPSLDGNLVPTEINRTEDYMVFELRNITVETYASGQQYENIKLYDASGNYTIYNVLVIADDRTYYFNATWSYDDVDGNGFINSGDRFILYNISAYDAESNPDLFFAVKGYGGTVEGKINTSLMKEI